jgi:hypothetical protein
MEIKELEKEIENIKIRNKKVESDKAWEKSLTRRISICILTYIIVLLYSYFINNKSNIFINSAVPVIGFFLSTLSLDLIKKIWTKKSNND